MWARSSFSYLATRWLRVEGFYVAVFQDSQRPGGHVNRSRAGIQVVDDYTHEDPLMEERSMHLFDYLAVVRRRRWWLVIPIAIGMLVGIALVLTLPREYQSSTTLAVTSPSMTTDLVKSSPTDLAERVRAISHELLSRPVLEQVVRDEGLADAASMDAAVADIRGRDVGLAAENARVGEPLGPGHVPRHLCRPHPAGDTEA